jgi:hypothetical protein
MKLRHELLAFVVVGASLVSALPGKASIYANLNERTVTGVNDGSAKVTIVKGKETFETVHESAKVPPGTGDLDPKRKLEVTMTGEGYKYYDSKFDKLKAIQIESRRSKAAQERGIKEYEERVRRGEIPAPGGSTCPPGQQMYRTNGLFGIGARNLGCMTAYEAQSLRLQQQRNIQQNFQNNRPRNCTTRFIGGTAFTNCY